MGWTTYRASYYKENGQIDRKAECDAYFMEGLNAGHYAVLKSAMVGATYYAAVKALRKGQKDENGEWIYVTIPENEQRVFAAVFLTSTNKRDYYNFGYKDMDESEGPYESNCPASILNLLSPTTYEYAIKWRERCWENIRRKKEGINLNTLPIGSVISYGLEKKTICIKYPPSYQFKTPFWKVEGVHEYRKKKYIPSDFEILYVGTGKVEPNWREKITESSSCLQAKA